MVYQAVSTGWRSCVRLTNKQQTGFDVLKALENFSGPIGQNTYHALRRNDKSTLLLSYYKLFLIFCYSKFAITCIKLKHMAIKAMPNIRYIEQNMKLRSNTSPSYILSPGTMSPKPIVLKDMKQKQDPSRNCQSSHLENSKAPPQMYLRRNSNIRSCTRHKCETE